MISQIILSVVRTTTLGTLKGALGCMYREEMPLEVRPLMKRGLAFRTLVTLFDSPMDFVAMASQQGGAKERFGAFVTGIGKGFTLVGSVLVENVLPVALLIAEVDVTGFALKLRWGSVPRDLVVLESVLRCEARGAVRASFEEDGRECRVVVVRHMLPAPVENDPPVRHHSSRWSERIHNAVCVFHRPPFTYDIGTAPVSRACRARSL